MSTGSSNIYSIPAGEPFAQNMVAEILARQNAQSFLLSDTHIFLPTRRACRILQDSFIEQNNVSAMILPHIEAIGDIDEEELTINISAHTADSLNIPPAIHPIKRQALLAQLITKLPQFEQSFDHALLLAKALGHFMDQIYTENLDMADLQNIVPAEFSEHWQITLEFLKILSEVWPTILTEHNVIDAADRRNRLILSLCDYWGKHPPKTPVIAAGTTGSIPAVAKLLSVIKNLPNGTIILPGFDHDIDEDSWNTLDETHPQFGFKHLCSAIGVDRAQIKPWPTRKKTAEQKTIIKARRSLARELNRPSQTSQEWTKLTTNKNAKTTFQTAFKNLSLIACDTQREEATTIAIILREALEQDGKTAALVTPDRDLTQRVIATMKRWNITIDDSAGIPLSQNTYGIFSSLCAQCCSNNLSPISLLTLLKHPLCHLLSKDEIEELELKILRGPKPAPGLNGLAVRINELEDNESLKITFEKLKNTFESEAKDIYETDSFKNKMRTHINLLKKLSNNAGDIFDHENAETLQTLFDDLLDQAHYFPDITQAQFETIIKQLQHSTTVRSQFGAHPRLQILGQLEARMINADLVIMGGLNEGIWPSDPGHDPWMSRPMRKDFGLPIYERSVGLAAHDFVQGFCSPEIIITRPIKRDGAPTIPARWLERLKTVLHAADLDIKDLENHHYKSWAKILDEHSGNITPTIRPAPTPPRAKRPKGLSATRIELWMKDPYSIYARYILKLKKIDDLEKPVDAATRGTLLHDILDEFTALYRDNIPANAKNILLDIAQKHLNKNDTGHENWHFWQQRFEKITDWYIPYETNWRKSGARIFATENTGAIQINNFTISAKADRIDTTPHGLAIIDYKSGGSYTKKAIEDGRMPQLSIEGLIASKGGFHKHASQHNISHMSYWILSGKFSAPGEVTEVTNKISEILERTQDGLTTLISEFTKEDTPYYAIPRAHNMPRFNDYEHLARIKEWSNTTEEDAA